MIGFGSSSVAYARVDLPAKRLAFVGRRIRGGVVALVIASRIVRA